MSFRLRLTTLASRCRVRCENHANSLKDRVERRAERTKDSIMDLRERSRGPVQAVSSVVEDHKTLIWLVGTASSALGGWAVYTLRSMHYAKIETEISSLSEQLGQMKEVWRTQSGSDDSKSAPSSVLSLLVVLVPAVCSSFLVGYLFGRTQGAYRMYKHQRLLDGVRKRRVYVAVLSEDQFDVDTVGKELERAVNRVE